MKIETFIKKILSDEDYKLKRLNAYNNYSLFRDKNNTVDEDLFLELIKKMQEDEALIKIYGDINEHILIKNNVTDRIFEELIAMAQKPKYSWMFVGLCHADLSKNQQEYLKSLGLNDSYFY